MDQAHLGVRFLSAAAAHATAPATRVRSGEGWTVRTYAELAADVRSLAARLVARGLSPGDRVAILAPNLPEWSLVDLACLTAGLVAVPLYATSTPDQVRHILADSGCRLVFVAGPDELARLVPVLPDLPDFDGVVSFVPVDDPAVTATLADELAAGGDSAAVDERLAAASADDLATIVYTSGTTGEPKGVMLGHRGFSHQIDVLNRYFTIGPADSSLCFLPLSHALERAWTYVVLTSGALNTYVADPRQVAAAMVQAQPTLLVSVPRLYEKVFLTAWGAGTTPLWSRAPSRAACSRSSTRWPTGWCCGASARRWAGRRTSSPAAARRYGRRSRSSSSAAGCSCCRGTASPRPRRWRASPRPTRSASGRSDGWSTAGRSGSARAVRSATAVPT
jgi:long-chain acyl-CoA synthetase